MISFVVRRCGNISRAGFLIDCPLSAARKRPLSDAPKETTSLLH